MISSSTRNHSSVAMQCSLTFNLAPPGSVVAKDSKIDFKQRLAREVKKVACDPMLCVNGAGTLPAKANPFYTLAAP